MTLCGGSYPASQGEHLVSHYLDMFAQPKSLHGEQVAVATLAMARLQERMLEGPAPTFRATAESEATLVTRFGDEIGRSCWRRVREQGAVARGRGIAHRPRACLLGGVAVGSARRRAARVAHCRRPAPRRRSFDAGELGLDASVFARAMREARFLRDRYTFLDLAGDAGHRCLVTKPARLTQQERHAQIVALVQREGTVRIATLADLFDVTTETARRDLDELAHAGQLNRTYGGGASRSLTEEPGIGERGREHATERARVGAAAAALVEAGDALMIDCGSTTALFAHALAARALRLTVLTNCLLVARALGSGAHCRVILCPGEYVMREGGVYGADTLDFIRRFKANKAFIGAGGITRTAWWTRTPRAARSSAR